MKKKNIPRVFHESIASSKNLSKEIPVPTVNMSYKVVSPRKLSPRKDNTDLNDSTNEEIIPENPWNLIPENILFTNTNKQALSGARNQIYENVYFGKWKREFSGSLSNRVFHRASSPEKHANFNKHKLDITEELIAIENAKKGIIQKTNNNYEPEKIEEKQEPKEVKKEARVNFDPKTIQKISSKTTFRSTSNLSPSMSSGLTSDGNNELLHISEGKATDSEFHDRFTEAAYEIDFDKDPRIENYTKLASAIESTRLSENSPRKSPINKSKHKSPNKLKTKLKSPRDNKNSRICDTPPHGDSFQSNNLIHSESPVSPVFRDWNQSIPNSNQITELSEIVSPIHDQISISPLVSPDRNTMESPLQLKRMITPLQPLEVGECGRITNSPLSEVSLVPTPSPSKGTINKKKKKESKKIPRISKKDLSKRCSKIDQTATLELASSENSPQYRSKGTPNISHSKLHKTPPNRSVASNGTVAKSQSTPLSISEGTAWSTDAPISPISKAQGFAVSSCDVGDDSPLKYSANRTPYLQYSVFEFDQSSSSSDGNDDVDLDDLLFDLIPSSDDDSSVDDVLIAQFNK